MEMTVTERKMNVGNKNQCCGTEYYKTICTLKSLFNRKSKTLRGVVCT